MMDANSNYCSNHFTKCTSTIMLYTLPRCTVLYVNYTSVKLGRRNSLAIQWLECCLPMQGGWVRSLVWELRSHMPCGQKKNPPKHKQKQYCNKFTEDFKNHPLGKKSLLIVKLEGYPTMMFIFGEAEILGNWEKLGGAPWHCTPSSPALHWGKAGSAICHPWWPIPSALGVGSCLRATALWTQKLFCLFFFSFPKPVFIHNSIAASLFPLLLWVRNSSLKVKYRSPGSVFLIWAADRGKKGQELEPGLGNEGGMNSD